MSNFGPFFAIFLGFEISLQHFTYCLPKFDVIHHFMPEIVQDMEYKLKRKESLNSLHYKKYKEKRKAILGEVAFSP